MQHSNVSIICLEELSNKMKEHSGSLIIIDCRSVMEYSTWHICDAVNIGGTRNARREIMGGRIPILSVLYERIGRVYNKDDLLVVYDQCSIDNSNIQSLAGRVADELSLCFTRVCFLRGGFIGFQSKFPELCWTNRHKMPDEDFVAPSQSITGGTGGHDSLARSHTMVSLASNQSCQLSPSGMLYDDHDEDTQTLHHSFPLNRHSLSGPALPASKEGPTIVLPYLLLGTQQDAISHQCIFKYGITHIINVSIDGPICPFISHKNFIRIPVQDNFDDKITPYFPKAFQFLDNVRTIGGRALVHCSAGISRSPTLAIGYLMKTKHISVTEAYHLVKSVRSSVSPNFNFLGQLTEYEKSLSEPTEESRHQSSSILSANPNTLVSSRQKKRPSRLGFFSSLLKHCSPSSPSHDNRLIVPSLLSAPLLPSPSVPFAKLGINSPNDESPAIKLDNFPTTSLDQLQFQPCQTGPRGVKIKRSATEVFDDPSNIRKRLSMMESCIGDTGLPTDVSKGDVKSKLCRRYSTALPLTPDPSPNVLIRDNSLDRSELRVTRSVSYERINGQDTGTTVWSRSSSTMIDSCRLQECHQSTSSLSSANSHSSNLLV